MQATLRTYLLAEGLGTAILLIFGTGAAVVDAQTHALGQHRSTEIHQHVGKMGHGQ